MDMMQQPSLTVSRDGTHEWRLPSGRLHRVDAPARIYTDGTQEWILHGERHRADGPSIINPNGIKMWHLHGKRHRTDGPAWIDVDGRQEWYMHGERITDQVNTWMRQTGVTWPWDAHTQAQFLLTFT